MSLSLAIVTATTNPARARSCLLTWNLPEALTTVVVLNTAEEPVEGIPTALRDLPATYVCAKNYLGTVPAFRAGVDFVLEHSTADLIACLHDDFAIHEPDWQQRTIRHFETHPACGLAGYGGAVGLGSADLYQTPYDPMQLARIGFRSNLVDAEVHGMRSLLAEPVACLDGFSQVGRREFWEGFERPGSQRPTLESRPLTYLADHGFVHHFYDGALGCLAARAGWETWYLPLRGRHYGGQTAVGDSGYQAWATRQIPGGDQGFWEQSHRRGYELFTDVLPLRL